jgi:hypothetical protein
MSNVDLDVPAGWVRMYHPELLNEQGDAPTSVVTLESFEDNHSEKGWEKVPEGADLKPVETVGTVVKSSSLKKAKPASGGTGGGS